MTLYKVLVVCLLILPTQSILFQASPTMEPVGHSPAWGHILTVHLNLSQASTAQHPADIKGSWILRCREKMGQGLGGSLPGRTQVSAWTEEQSQQSSGWGGRRQTKMNMPKTLAGSSLGTCLGPKRGPH